MPEKQKKSKKLREKKMKGGVWPFDLLKKGEVEAPVGEVVPVEPVVDEDSAKPTISEEELAGLKQNMIDAKVVYDNAKKAYNDAKPSMFNLFGGKTRKRRSKK